MTAITTLGIDLDGVVCDFATAANEYMAGTLGVPPIAIDRYDWWRGYGATHNQGVVEQAWESLWNEAVPKGFFLGVGPVPGAIDALNDLREKNYTLVFCTARPVASASDTQAWLDGYGFGGHALFITGSAKAKRYMGVDLLLDDRGDTVQRHLKAGKKAALFQQPWNAKDWLDMPSVANWGLFLAALDGKDAAVNG